MAHKVVSRFWHAASERYVDPGQPCPPLDGETAQRLQASGCIEIDVATPPVKPQGAAPAGKDRGAGSNGVAAPKGGKRARGAADAS